MLGRLKASLDLLTENPKLADFPGLWDLQLENVTASACKELFSIQGEEMAQNET